MAQALAALVNRIRTERGQALAEFTLVLAFIALVCVAALALIGQAAIEPFENFVSGLD
jgi:Flp pilus assembly pilin Flp